MAGQQGRVAGKVAIVTGAGAIGEGWGLGKASAARLAREGAKVLVVDMNPEAAEATHAVIKAEGFESAVAIGDVSKSADWARFVQTCLDTFGRLDILVNNVGIVSKPGLLEETEDGWNRNFAVNVTGPFLGARAVIPTMIKQGWGRIVNVSSIAALRSNYKPGNAYSCSKAAVIQLTQGIGIEFARQGIRCNCVVPGTIDTPIVRHAYAAHGFTEEQIEGVLRGRDANSPTGKQGTSWDIANAVLYLTSDESDYVNGTTIVVDGGLTNVMVSPKA